MQLKNITLEPITQACIDIGKRSLPVPKRLEFIKLRKAIGVAFDSFNELRNDLIKEHGEDGRISPEMEGWPTFQAAYQELLMLDVEVPVTPVCMADFTDQEFGPEFDILYENNLITL